MSENKSRAVSLTMDMNSLTSDPVTIPKTILSGMHLMPLIVNMCAADILLGSRRRISPVDVPAFPGALSRR